MVAELYDERKCYCEAKNQQINKLFNFYESRQTCECYDWITNMDVTETENTFKVFVNLYLQFLI